MKLDDTTAEEGDLSLTPVDLEIFDTLYASMKSSTESYRQRVLSRPIPDALKKRELETRQVRLADEYIGWSDWGTFSPGNEGGLYKLQCWCKQNRRKYPAKARIIYPIKKEESRFISEEREFEDSTEIIAVRGELPFRARIYKGEKGVSRYFLRVTHVDQRSER